MARNKLNPNSKHLSNFQIQQGIKTIEQTRLDNIANPLRVGDCVQLLPRLQERFTNQLAWIIRLKEKRHILKVKQCGTIIQRDDRFLFVLTQPTIPPLAAADFPLKYPAPTDYVPPPYRTS